MNLSMQLLPDTVDLAHPFYPSELVVDEASTFYAESGMMTWLSLQDVITFSTGIRFCGLIRDMPRLQHLTVDRLSRGDAHYDGGDNGPAEAIARACPTLRTLMVPHPGMAISSDTLASILRVCPQLISLHAIQYESGMLGVLATTPMLGSLDIRLIPDWSRSDQGLRVLSELTTFVRAPGCFSGKLDMTSKCWTGVLNAEEREIWNHETARLTDRASFHLDARMTTFTLNLEDCGFCVVESDEWESEGEGE